MISTRDFGMGSEIRELSGGRLVNLALLGLVPLAVLSGLFANAIGSDWRLDPAWIHGALGLTILAVSPWKSPLIRKGLRRRRQSAALSAAFLALVLTTLGTGVLHATGYDRGIGPLTVMQAHVGAALPAALLLVFHYRAHPVRVRRSDADRRAFLRTAAWAAAGALAWVGMELGMDAAGLPGGDRRFTGSHERSSFAPGGMPVTAWFDDDVQHLSSEDWRLKVAGTELSFDDLGALPQEDLSAVLDCTSGWYSEQVWTGVRLDRLIDIGDGRSVEVRSATGYVRRFPARDLPELWLATRMGGEPLSSGHGFPARLVAPNRRGFWWVKWVVAVDSSNVPWWLQLPFPAS